MADRELKKVAKKPKLGKKALNFLITDTNRRKLRRRLKDRAQEKARTKKIRQVSHPGESHLEDILHICLKHIKPLTTPLALISQAPYSGGSLLSRLFDGHSKIYAYPSALVPANTIKNFWPKIDLAHKPEDWLKIISKHFALKTFRAGFKPDEKGGQRMPHMFLPVLQERIFLKYLASLATIKTRDVFDAWMTACFGAWLNYQNHGYDKKFVTALAPGLVMQSENVENFFEIYPEGRVIALVRDPAQWFVTVSRHEPKTYGDAKWAISRWKESVRAVMETRKKFGDRVCLIKFEDLVTQTQSIMRFLSGFLRIPYEDILLKPTFNGIAIQPVTGQKTGNDEARYNNFIESKKLDEDERKLIKKMTDADYQTALREVVVL
jgi:hypothetical protein